MISEYLIKKAEINKALLGGGLGAALGGFGAYALTSPEKNEPYANYDYRRVRNALIAALVLGGAGAVTGNQYDNNSSKLLNADDLKSFGINENSPLDFLEQK